MAPPVRRQIRPVRVIPFEDVEDQLWPINLLVVVLAGFVVGLILGLSRFDDPRLFYNAYFQLFTVGLTLGVWFAAVRWVRGRFKQRLKIAALFSLVAHLWLVLSLGVGYYRLILEAKPNQGKVEEIAELRVPDYPDSLMEQGEQPSPYHRPVETPLPSPQTPESAKRPLETSLPPGEKPLIPMPRRPEPEPVPPIPVERREVSPPHRAESPGEVIRRQIAELRQEPSRPLPLPELRPAAPPKGPEAPKELLPRQPSQPPQPQRIQPPVSAPQRPAPAAAPSAPRKVQTPEQPLVSESGGLNRAIRPAPDLSVQAETPPPPPPAKSEQTASVYQPRALALQRQESQPLDRKLPVSVPQVPAQAPARSAGVPRSLEQPIPMAQMPDQLPPRQQAKVLQATVPQEPLPQLASAPEIQRPIGPLQTPVARQQPTIGQLAERAGPPHVQSPLSQPAAGPVALAPGRRPEESALGGQWEAGPADRLAARSAQPPRFEVRTEQLQLRAAPEPTPTPSPFQVGQADAVAPEPVPHSLDLPGHRSAQALAGSLHPVTGAGLAQPASAARRVQASQQAEEGLLAPSQRVSLLPRRPTGTPTPSAVVPHEEASLAGATGSAQSSGGDQLSQWEAGSQTALSRQAPGAPLALSSRANPPVNPTIPSGPGGIVTTSARPSEGGMISLPLGQRSELGRSTTGETRLAGLDGRTAETLPGPASFRPSAGANAETATGQPGASLQPGKVSEGRLQTGTGLPGTRSAGEVSWHAPAGVGGVELGALRRGGGGSETILHGTQEGGIPGPARQLGRLPTQDLAGKIPETGIPAGEGTGLAKGGPQSEGTANTSLEPVLPGGGQRTGVSSLEGLVTGRPGGAAQPGGHLSGTKAGGSGEGVVIGTGLGKLRAKESEQAGLPNALAGMPIPRAVRVEIPGSALEGTPNAGGAPLNQALNPKALTANFLPEPILLEEVRPVGWPVAWGGRVWK